MREIIFDNPHRQKHFEFFNGMNYPHFQITANVEITALLPFLHEKKLSFTPTIVYLISRAANEIQEFRWRIRNSKVVEHDRVHPSFTVTTKASDVFSFCTVEYAHQAKHFIEEAKKQIEAMQLVPSFEDEEGRDDFLFLSAIPWVSFTGFQHAMSYHPTDSVPRLVWGKYFEENGKVKMPVSVQVHHALVNGKEVGLFFQNLEAMCMQPEAVLL